MPVVTPQTKEFIQNKKIEPYLKKLNNTFKKLREDQKKDIHDIGIIQNRKRLVIIQQQKEKMFRAERKLNSGDQKLAEEIHDEVLELGKEIEKIELETVKKQLEIAERKIITSEKIVIGRNKMCPLCLAKGVEIKWKKCKEHNAI